MHHPQPSLINRLQGRIKTSLDALLLDLRSTGERGRLVRETITVLALRAGALGVAFVAGIIYARTLKASGYGIYAYVLAWNDVVLITVGLGFPEYLVREASKHKDPGHLRGIMRWADRRLLISGSIGAVIISCVGYVIPGTEGMGPLFMLVAWMPLLAVLAIARQSILRASDAVVASQWPSLLMAPTLMLALLLAWWAITGHLTPGTLLIAMLISLGVSLVIQEWQVRRRLGAGPVIAAGNLSLADAFPFMLISAIWYINSRVDLLILGALKSHADVGVYAVVLRVAGLVMLATFTVNTIIAPRIAAYHHQGDHARLQRLVVASTQRTFFLCLPLGLILVLMGGPLLGLVFGAEFARGWAPLAILVSAQLFCIMCGPTAIILNMAGLERITNRTFAFATLVNIALNFILIPGLGLVGAAIATSVSLISWNVVLLAEVRKRLNLRPTAVGI